MADTPASLLQDIKDKLQTSAEEQSKADQKMLETFTESLEAISKSIGIVEDNTDPKQEEEVQVKSFQRFFGIDFKEKFTETLGAIPNMLEGLAGKASSKLTDARDSVVGGLATLGKFVAAFIGIQAGLQGFEKATKWFGENADFGDKIASAMANVVATFTGMDETQTIALATSISTFIDSVSTVASKIAATAKVITDWVLTGSLDGDALVTSFKDLANTMWEYKGTILGVALMVAPGSTIRLATTAIKLAFSAMSLGLSGLSSLAATLSTPVLAATLVAGAIINTLHAFGEAIDAFKEKWAESGSFMESLGEAWRVFISEFIGWPIKLGLGLVNWVRGLLGFDEIWGDWDPAVTIKGWLDNISGWFNAKMTWLGTKWEAIKEGANSVWQGLVTPISDFIDGVKATFAVWSAELQLAWLETKLLAVGIWSGIANKIGEVVSWIYNPETGEVFGIDFMAILDSVKAKVAGIPDRIAGAFSNILGGVEDMFYGFVNKIIDKINNIPGVEIKKVKSGRARDNYDYSKHQGDTAVMTQGVAPEGALSADKLAGAGWYQSQEDIRRIQEKMLANEEMKEKLIREQIARVNQSTINSVVTTNTTLQSGQAFRTLTVIDP
ncbi:MAG: hypothetical protein N0C84_00810 [Candidatus Thiodiazotropha taylori]|uniref:Uncharacterized protein n=1 Tax=Candidatus Thiodiazotropha taylori TaxID=2792791 RepID=A0A9E4KA84_9GAMM|nr:hypothetical protein [Candidatus Thiodiazotropha taylori]MCW4254986.1 hypothetical protein [Candidatus Thiodiazotropha taylori]